MGHEIDPARLMRTMAHGGAGGGAALTQAYLCSQCGVCDSYACVMGLSPKRLYAEIRGQLVKGGVSNPHHRSDLRPKPYRGERRVPLKRLLARLALSEFDRPAPLEVVVHRPNRVTIPLLQGAGRPCRPAVTLGERVGRGQLLGEPPAGSLGAAVHTSISGTVELVSSDVVTIKAG